MRIAIIDDCKADQQAIGLHMAGYLQDAASVPDICYFDSGEAFLSGFAAGRFDLILLDCCMNGMNGIETALEIRKADKRVILVFITTSADYAVDGYLVAASGYLMKPFTGQSFAQAMQVALYGSRAKHAYVTLPTNSQPTKILLRDIVFCDTDRHYIQVHRPDNAVLRVRMTFAELLALLAPHTMFLETYRGCVVNMGHIQKVEKMDFLMDTGARVPFRKKEQKKLMRLYAEYLVENAQVESQCI